MNPTDEVDDLLTRAGARWRADQPSAPEPDLERMLGGCRRPRGWVPALAAASVAAIAAAALTVLPGGDKEPVAGPAGTARDAEIVCPRQSGSQRRAARPRRRPGRGRAVR